MTTEIYPTGDTIQVRATFRDYAVAPAVGSLMDPDELEVNIYNARMSRILNVPDGDSSIVRASTGVYTYEWELPSADGTYYIEFHGTASDLPIIRRMKVKVKWKPVDN